MHLFYIFMGIALASIVSALSFNQVKKNALLLRNSISEISKLKGMLYCATSEHDCEKALEYKKNIANIENSLNKANIAHCKILNNYKIQYKLLSPFAKKINLDKPEKFEINIKNC